MARMRTSESIRREAAALRVSASRLDALADMLDGVAEPEPKMLAPGEFFSWAELSVTGTGIANEPTDDAKAQLWELCRVILDPLRRHVGKPITVTSAYRSPAVNSKVGSTSKSQHTKGQAADIKVSGVTALDLAAEVLALGLPFDQLITYDDKGHVHISYKPQPRRQQLRHVAGTYEKWDHA